MKPLLARAGILALALSMAGVGCAVQATESGVDPAHRQADEPSTVQKFKSLLKDARDFDFDPLINLGATFADDGLSEIPMVDVSTELYGLESDRFDGVEIKPIEQGRTGLAENLGDTGLSGEVNAARTAYVDDQGGFYAESTFELSPGYDTDWNLDDALGLDGLEPLYDNDDDSSAGQASAGSHVGFDVGAQLGSTVVTWYGDGSGRRLPDEASALLRNPLKAAKELRGFAYPRSLGDIRDMQPGESFALHGQGAIGLRFGASIPITAVNVTSIATYNVTFGASLRGRMQGDLDVQLVRLPGDEVVVDVGMSRVRSAAMSLAIQDQWGVGITDQIEDLVGFDPSVDLGIAEINLNKIAEKGLRKQLNDKLTFFEAAIRAERQNARLTVARFRMQLPEGEDEAFEQALAQSLKGDIRLAQGLALADHPGVDLVFDVAHSGTSRDFYAGLDLFSLKFFRQRQSVETSAVIQTPEGAQVLLFDTYAFEGGVFRARHGHTRKAVSSLLLTPDGGVRSEANLVLRLSERDSRFQRDKLLDHADSVIVAVGGWDSLTAIEIYGNAMEQLGERCRRNDNGGGHNDRDSGGEIDFFESQRCAKRLITELEPVRAKALRRLDDALSARRDLNDEAKGLVRELAVLRLAAQSVFDDRPQTLLAGPPSSLSTDVLLDDAAVHYLMTQVTEEQGRNAFTDFLRVANAERKPDRKELAEAPRRGTDLEKIDSVYETLVTKLNERRLEAASNGSAMAALDAMVATFAKYRAEYLAITNSQTTVREGLEGTTLEGTDSLFLRLPVAGNRVTLEEVALQSYGKARADLAAKVYDDLYDHADDIFDGYNPHPEMYVTYALLAIIPDSLLHMGVDVTVDLSQIDENFRDRVFWNGYRERYETAVEIGYRSTGPLTFRGIEVSPISAMLFDIDALGRVQVSASRND